MRNSLVWASQGIYSKHEYLERIFANAILGDGLNENHLLATADGNYESIGEYKIKDYVERPHEYVKGE